MTFFGFSLFLTEAFVEAKLLLTNLFSIIFNT